MKNNMRHILALALALTLTACGGDVIDGKKYDSYGVATESVRRDPNIEYELSAASVIWAIILSETIFVPVYIVGWDLFKPVGLKKKP